LGQALLPTVSQLLDTLSALGYMTLHRLIIGCQRLMHDVMFIHFVDMGEVDKEIQRIAHGGQAWQRQPDESEQALKERAQQGANPNPHGATVFLCH
jgi:hypothetical protein